MYVVMHSIPTNKNFIVVKNFCTFTESLPYNDRKLLSQEKGKAVTIPSKQTYLYGFITVATIKPVANYMQFHKLLF